MWKRFNRPPEKAIGNPTLMETTLDERSVEGLTSLNSGEFSISSRPAFGRKQTEDVLKDLPKLPFQSTDALEHTDDRPYSTVSSVYSQPALVLRQKQPRLVIPRASSVYPDDISPPDSPRTVDGARSKKSSPNISPITETGSTSRTVHTSTKPYASGIPLPKNQQPTGGAPATISGWRDKVKRDDSPSRDPRLTRWDDFSGEPTNSEAGKPAQAVPGTTQFEQQYNQGMSSAGYGNVVEISGGAQTAAKARKMGKGNKSTPRGMRPEWKGASGRSKIVQPLTDKPLPLGKKAEFPRGTMSPELIAKPRIPTVTGRSAPVVSGRSSPAVDFDTSEDRPSLLTQLPAVDVSILPLVPLKIGRNSPHAPTKQGSTPPRSSDFDTRSPVARNPSAEEVRGPDLIITTPPLPSSPETPEINYPDTTESQIRAATQSIYLSNEPKSRFSATTFNSTVPESPPATPRRSLDAESPPPLPEPVTSVLNRKRPVPTSGATMANKAPSRKPTPAELGSGPAKALPQPPPEVEIVDRVALLQAKLDSLNRRKANLQTVIHELTDVVQPSSIIYDKASRQEIKKTVEGLHKESADVAKEIHETGLKLHRVMKRRDEESMFEPTGLWVRRVTE